MKILGILARWLFILLLPLLFLSVSIGWAVNSLWLYEYGFDKYDVSQTTGLSKGQLEKAGRGLISYFNSGEEYISLTAEKEGRIIKLFNQREVGHLKDVKGLIRLDYWLLVGTLAYALAYSGVCLFRRRRRYLRDLARAVVWGSALTGGLMLLLGVASLFNFERLFLEFHLLSFSNNLWQLDPRRDYLIMLFPQGFWFDAAMFCVLATAGLALVFGGVAGFLLTRRGLNRKMEGEGND